MPKSVDAESQTGRLVELGGWRAAANAHQQLRAIIITAFSDNIIIAQSGGESEAICKPSL